MNNVVVNLGAGVWLFSGDAQFTGVTLNGTDATPTAIDSTLPRMAGQLTDGVTVLRTNYNFNFTNNTDVYLRAPTAGPAGGLALGFVAGLPAQYTYFAMASDVTFEWSGLLYMPSTWIIMQGNSGLVTMAGPDGTAASGCSQVVADRIMFGHRTYTGNYCAGKGLKAWGTGASG